MIGAGLDTFSPTYPGPEAWIRLQRQCKPCYIGYTAVKLLILPSLLTTGSSQPGYLLYMGDIFLPVLARDLSRLEASSTG